jgi:3-oxoacyl-[acyl-carrier protein] reductase
MNEQPLVLLTGASGGIGRSVLNALVTNGYRVAAVAGARKAQLDVLAEGLGSAVRTYACDLADAGSRLRLHAELVAAQGHPSVLLANAAINVNGMCWKLPLEEWRRVMAVNVESAFHLSQLCIPAMRDARHGRIIYTSSVVAQRPLAGAAAYAASKAALLGLMRAQAVELADRGITVNAVAPGYLDTGLIEQVPPGLRSEIERSIPLGRLGDAHELAALLLWLIGPDAGYVTGQTLHFNGGLAG